MKGKKHTIRKLIIGLIVLLVVLYAGVVAMVCIREGSVLKTVPAADEYDAIVVLGAQVKPDGSPSIQLSWRLDAAWEAWEQKHVPVVEINGRDITVTVGSAEHPMMEEHFIMWVALETKQGAQRKELHPGDAPVARFALAEGDEAVAAYDEALRLNSSSVEASRGRERVSTKLQ